MLPIEYDLYLEQGYDFTEEFTLFNDDETPIDLANANITASFARSFTTSDVHSFNIYLDPDDSNKFHIQFAGDDLYDIRPDRYWWNGFYVLDGNRVKFAKGIVTINGSVNNA